jgi:hypothetical protein
MGGGAPNLEEVDPHVEEVELVLEDELPKLNRHVQICRTTSVGARPAVKRGQ